MQPQNETNPSWKQENSKRRERIFHLRYIGWIAAVVAAWGVVKSIGEIVGIASEPMWDNPVLAAGGWLAVCILGLCCGILPGRAKRLADREARKRATATEYDGASAWDARLQELRGAGAAGWRKVWRNALLAGGIVLALGLAIVAAAYLAGGDTRSYAMESMGDVIGGVFVFAIMAAGIAFAISWAVNKSASHSRIAPQEFKQAIVLPVLQQRLENPVFHNPAGFDTSCMGTSGIIGKVVFANVNDILTGSYKGVPFAQWDAKCTGRVYVKSHRDSNGNYVEGRWETKHCFNGRWLSLASQKNLQNGFYLWSKNFENAGGKMQGMKRIKLDDENFNRLFKVYAFNGQDPYRFLTPALLQRLTALCQTDDGQTTLHAVGLMAVGTTVQIAIQGVLDAFEPWHPSHNGMLEANAKRRVNGEVSVLTDTIDAMLPNLM